MPEKPDQTYTEIAREVLTKFARHLEPEFSAQEVWDWMDENYPADRD